jgi:hypothetical protein
MGFVEEVINVSMNLLQAYRDPFYHRVVKNNKGMLHAFMNVHVAVFTPAKRLAPRVASGEADVDELKDFVETVVLRITQNCPTLIAYGHRLTKNAESNIVPYFQAKDGDAEFWTAFDAPTM